MMEMKITVEAPDLAASIIKLAEAIASGPDPNLLTPDEPRPVSSYPTTPAPAVAAPVAAPVAPVSPAPVTPTATPTPAPGPAVAAPAPTAGPASVTPGNTPAPAVPVTTAPAVPVTTAPAYTLDQISRAGASLVDAGKMQQLLELLGRYGVQAVTQLQPEQYGTFATELRALGAQI